MVCMFQHLTVLKAGNFFHLVVSQKKPVEETLHTAYPVEKCQNRIQSIRG